MPNTESAKKRMRQNKARRALNRWRKERLKLQVRSLNEAIRVKDLETAEAELRKTCSILDKVSSTSTMHKNTAARKKSRLASRVNALRSA